MRRLLIIIAAAASILMLCSCSNSSADGNLPENEIETQISDPVPDIHTFYKQYNEENAKAWEQLDKSEWQTFTEDFDGLVITVTTDKSEYGSDEPIRVKATLQNKTGRDIYLYYSNSYLNYPIEFYSDLSQNGDHLLNNRDGARDCVVEIITVKPDEERTDYLNYRTYCPKKNRSGLYGGDEELAEKGVYSGSCWITVCSDPDDPIGDHADHSVDFSVTLK